MQEAEAIARLQRGDAGGLAALVQRYQVPALRAATLITRDRALAEDIVQAAFVRAYERIGQFDPQRPFGPWFLRSVVNDAVKAASRGRRQMSLDEAYESKEALALGEWLADPAPGPEEQAQQAELRQTIRTALERLSPAERAVIVLRYYLAATESEMAQELGCPPGTIKSRLSAARSHLRRRLGQLRPAAAQSGQGRSAVSHPRLQAEGKRAGAEGGDPCSPQE